MDRIGAKLVVFMLLVLFSINQLMYLTPPIDLSLTSESTIRSEMNTSHVNPAHLTEPTTLPAVHDYKADLPAYAKKIHVSELVPNTHYFCDVSHVTIFHRFLGARIYQSSYLS